MTKFVRYGGDLAHESILWDDIHEIPDGVTEILISKVTMSTVTKFTDLVDIICQYTPKILKLIDIRINGLRICADNFYFHSIIKIINLCDIKVLYIDNNIFDTASSNNMMSAIANSNIHTLYLSWHIKYTEFNILKNNKSIRRFGYHRADARSDRCYKDYTFEMDEHVYNNRIQHAAVIQKCIIILSSKILYRDLKTLITKYILFMY